MSQLSLFDLELSRNARDYGIAVVNENNEDWRVLAHRVFGRVFKTGEFVTGEDMRTRLTDYGLPRPKSSNAWGGLTSSLVKSGRLRDTGHTRQMADLRSHARRTPLWVVN